MPLTDAYTRLTRAHPGLRVTEEAPRSGGGWAGAQELAEGGAALETYLAWDEEQVGRDHGRAARPDVVAGFGFHRYAWPACLLFTVPWFLYRRVPRLGAADVSFHRTEGRMTARPSGFACLPGDPAAAATGTTVVADAAELRARLRDSVAEHLGPVLDGFRPRIRRGPRVLWGMATDEIVDGLWHIGQLLGEEPRAVAELAELLSGSTAPYTGGAGFRELAGARGEPVLTRDRVTCCLFYTVSPAETCGTCPRTTDAERLRRLAATA